MQSAANTQQTAQENLTAALSEAPDEKLASSALQLARSEYIAIPRENDFDLITEAQTAFYPPTQPDGPDQTVTKSGRPSQLGIDALKTIRHNIASCPALLF